MYNEKDLRWSDIKNRKKLLLSNSDWTQLPDSGLNLPSVKEWREWRQKVRSITQANYTLKRNALDVLEDLESNQPVGQFSTDQTLPNLSMPDDMNMPVDIYTQIMLRIEALDSLSDTEEIREESKKILDSVYDYICPRKPYNYANILEEKFSEALDLLTDQIVETPILKSIASAVGKSEYDVADDVVREKREWIEKVSNVEYIYHKAKLALDKCRDRKEFKKVLNRVIKHGH